MSQPILSIVVPTREGFAEHWLNELVKIKGDVEFILVHPPGMKKHPKVDERLQQINSSFRGEIIQRMTGMLNASGKYLLTVNCDEYLTPDIVQIATDYFAAFPDSWVVRLSRNNFKFGDKSSLDKPWADFSQLKSMPICPMSEDKKQETNLSYNAGNCLLEIPIAPLDTKFDFGCFFRTRKDHHGIHTENFDKKIWKNELLQPTLQDILETMKIFGPVKYVPFWCLDRLLGLFIQAKFFKKGKIIGHLLPQPEQIRIEENPPEYKKSRRFYVFAEILLLRKFQNYGYLWNLIVDQIRGSLVRGFNFAFRRS
ncbi:transposase [Hyella patelloides]|nr:transposase [Hyella patelloides]